MKKFDQYCSNLAVLAQAAQEDLSNQFILSGILNKFSLQFELGWKTLKEFLQYEGRQEASSGSPREVLKAAFSIYDCLDEDIWLSMLNARNRISHIYDGSEAQRLVGVVLRDYIPAFLALQEDILQRYPALVDPS